MICSGDTCEVFQQVWRDALRRLHPFTFKSADENKYFLDMADMDSPCNVVTLGTLPTSPSDHGAHLTPIGIGGDVEAERALAARYPQCQFLAVDPDEMTNHQLVKKIHGRYVKAVVGGHAGNYTAMLRSITGKGRTV